MASIFEQYGIKEVADITFYELDNLGRQKPVLYIDTAKVSTIEKTASTAEARGGKANPELISWDFGLEINVTLEDALFSSKSMAIMQGSGKVVEGSASAPVYVDITNEAVTIDANGVFNLAHEAKEDSIYIYMIDDNGRWTNGQQLHNVTQDADDKKKFTLSASDITLYAGEDAVCFYKSPIKTNAAQVVKINSDTFPGTYRVVGDTYARSRATGKDEFFQFIIHRAKMSAENTITLSADGDPSTFNMSLKVLKNVADNGMIELVKYSFDASEDADASDTGASTEGSTTSADYLELSGTNIPELTRLIDEGTDLATEYAAYYTAHVSSVSGTAATALDTATDNLSAYLSATGATGPTVVLATAESAIGIGSTDSEVTAANTAVETAISKLDAASTGLIPVAEAAYATYKQLVDAA